MGIDDSAGANDLARPQSGMRALVVEDEVELAGLVGSYLQRDGFETALAHDGAVATAREVDPDVIVLDLGLPSLDGVEVCRQIRTFSDCYIVILTARAEEIDTLIGLAVGADDYMAKPFSPRVLIARIMTMLRRPRTTLSTLDGHQAQRFGALAIDVQGRDVWLDGEPVQLTRTEFDVLAALADHPRMAFSRRQLIERVWGETWVGDEHLVDVHVGHLRRKLGDDATRGRYVRTMRGIGYRMGTGE